MTYASLLVRSRKSIVEKVVYRSVGKLKNFRLYAVEVDFYFVFLMNGQRGGLRRELV